MTDRVYWRLTDMKAAITDIRDLLAGKQFDVLNSDRAVRAAFERFLEILSEASRHVPDDWKKSHPQIPWRQVADLGNHVRHAYHRIDLEILWTIYTSDLDALEAAVDALLQKAKE
ncbi:MAG TPA: HepT-like ribonuclease domain-containing protein [Xanthobacteraceae bacterium]|nr:HepT-like ribonuclease domain-containing protein [Xanthobacteraceae bacterium]